MEGETVVFRNSLSNVLETLREEFSLDDIEIELAVYDLNLAYGAVGEKPSFTNEPVDYNDPSHRCEYFHKYVGCHAAMVDYVLSHYLVDSVALRCIGRAKDVLNICCLGGGPGTDVTGLRPTLFDELRPRAFQFTILDCTEGWASTFHIVLEEASLVDNDSLQKLMSELVSHSYVCDNLLYPDGETMEAIGSADLVTMVKFESAVDARRVPEMLQELFRGLKRGAVVLFIDNAAGGFHEMVYEAATDCRLTELFAICLNM